MQKLSVGGSIQMLYLSKKKKKSQNVFYVLKVKVLIENWNKVPPPAVLHSM